MTQDYRKEKEESKETMALEGVTDGRNDKTEKKMTRNMYTTREHGTGHVFCFVVLPSFVLTDNKCILSCVIIRSKL